MSRSVESLKRNLAKRYITVLCLSSLLVEEKITHHPNSCCESRGIK
jgi:hypothetical protein